MVIIQERIIFMGLPPPITGAGRNREDRLDRQTRQTDGQTDRQTDIAFWTKWLKRLKWLKDAQGVSSQGRRVFRQAH